jgi:hypothetical protein
MTSGTSDDDDDSDNVFVTASAAEQQRAAEQLLDKLRDFARDLDELERAALAALLAPGFAMAYGDDASEVQAFGLVEWMPEHLPEALARTVRRHELRVDEIDRS